MSIAGSRSRSRLAQLFPDAEPQLARRLVGELHAAPGAADAAREVVRGRPGLGESALITAVSTAAVDDGRGAGVDLAAVERDPAHRRLAQVRAAASPMRASDPRPWPSGKIARDRAELVGDRSSTTLAS